MHRPICQAFGRTPTVVAPGDSRTLVLIASDDPTSHAEFSADREGVYRLVAPDARDGRGRPGALQSNLFVIAD